MNVKKKEDSSDKELLKNIFFSSLRLADPVTKLRQLKFTKPPGRLFFVAVGKGAGRHAKAFKSNYDGLADGVVILPENEECEDLGFKVFKASHPVPSSSGLEASKYLVTEVKRLKEKDLLIFCISGGASALLPYPPKGFTLDDEIHLNRTLLSSGLSIKEMNVYRGVFSQIKAGKLAKMAYPCPIISLVVSDIPGDELALVGSGPTFIQKTNLSSLTTLKFGDKIDEHIKEALSSHRDEKTYENGQKAFCLSSSKILFDGATNYINKTLGLSSLVLSSQFEGDPRSLVQLYKKTIQEISESKNKVVKPVVILSGGEVEIKLPKNHGIGGRNSQFSLALAKAIEGMEGVTALSADTDGIDGNGSNAGAIVDGFTYSRLQKYYSSVDPVKFYDSFNILKKSNSLFCTGPTGINLNDFRAVLVR